MKNLLSLLAITLISASVIAQSPEKISYQAVVRDSENQLVTNQNVGLQVRLLQGSSGGTAVYSETHTPQANGNGLISIEIGTGTSGDNFSTIDWADGPYFIESKVDPTGGANYSISGVSQILSVPYAIHAKTAEDVQNLPDFEGWDKNESDDFSGNYNDLTNKPDHSNWDKDQSDDFSGNYNDLTNKPTSFNDADADPENELQTLNIEGNQLSISNGNTITLPKPSNYLAFLVRPSSNVEYNSGTHHKIDFGSIKFDTQNNFNITNDRFTATKKGIYHFSAFAGVSEISGGDYVKIYLEINGSGTNYWLDIERDDMGNHTEFLSGSITLELNKNDYVELYLDVSESVVVSTATIFSGHIVCLSE